MKNIKILLLLILGLSLTTSCIDDDNDELTGGAITGGLLTLNNTAIGYVVGNDATYTATGTVYQGSVQTEMIEVYKSFTNSNTGSRSNEILLRTINVAETSVGANGTFSIDFTYEDLISGLTIDGSPLPASDSALSIGDFWTLRYESTLSSGNVVSNAGVTKVSVGTRFAGLYQTVEAAYYRIGVLTYTGADFQNFVPVQVIESVDATTYRVVEYFGVFAGNTWYFEIDENDNITYPETTPEGDAQTGNGQPFITCQSHPNEMTNVPCGAGTNMVIRDDVNGKDQLIMSYGYLTGNTSGNAREFYQVLEKIVD